MKYTITADNLHIVDSWKVSKKDMDSVLSKIWNKHPNSRVWKRTPFSLRMEWVCHNFLFSIGYKRARTTDVDLDYPADRPEWLYNACGILCWIFVK